SISLFADPNHTARASGDVSTLLCPSDPSSGQLMDTTPMSASPGPIGRTNYQANLGAHSSGNDASMTLIKPPELAGGFSVGSRVALTDILDGSSNTALFAEIRRGAATSPDRFDITRMTAAQWNVTGSNAFANTPRNVNPLADNTFITACNAAASTGNTT